MSELQIYDVTWKDSVPGKYKSMAVVASCPLHAVYFHPSGKYIFSVVTWSWHAEDHRVEKLGDWVDVPLFESLSVVARGRSVNSPPYPVISSTWNK